MTAPAEPECFLIRTEGGPLAGTRVIDQAEHPSWTWPLPATLHGELGLEGTYVKVQESQLPPMPRDGHVMRGALYEWTPA